MVEDGFCSQCWMSTPRWPNPKRRPLRAARYTASGLTPSLRLEPSSSSQCQTVRSQNNVLLQHSYPKKSVLYHRCSLTGWFLTVEYVLWLCAGSMVTVGMNVDGFQALSSDGATLAMQHVMMGNHSEDESEESGNEDDADLSSANMTGLDLDVSD